MSAGAGPPAFLRSLLRHSLPSGPRGEAILGDLHEEFVALERSRGRRAACAWYRRQAVRVLGAYVLPRWLGLVPRIDRREMTLPSRWALPFAGIVDDLSHGVRRLRRQPVPAALTVATLAFAIGVNTAMFSVVDAVLWKPLPFPAADRLVQVQETNPDYVVERGLDYRTFNVNALDFLEYEDRAGTIESMAFVIPYHNDGYTLVGGEELPTERVEALGVSHDFFQTLGVQPALGRAFLESETASPGEYDYTPVVILSHDLWSRRFRSDPEIVGKTIRIEAAASTVVGVMPPGFSPPPFSSQGQTRVVRPDVFFPPFYEAFYQPNRQFRQLVVIGRLAEGAAVDDAEQDLGSTAAGLAEQEPERRAGWTAVVTPIEELAGKEVEPSLYALMGAVLFVLLIGCANLANLLLAIGSTRRGELAVRSALGSGRRRLVRQLVTENVLLASIGGLLGVVLARSASGALLDFVPFDIPMAADAGIDGRVLLFAITLTGTTTLAFGLLPAVRTARVDVASLLKAGGGTSGAVRVTGFSGGLILAQVALTLVLLVGSSLLAKSFVQLQSVPLGFEPERLLVTSLQRGRQAPDRIVPRDDEEGLRGRWERIYAIEDGVGRIPGIESVFFAGALPIQDGGGVFPVQFERTEQGQRPERTLNATLAHASPGYFDGLGIPIVRGTGLPEWDRENDWARYWWATDCRPPHEAYCVAVVSETFAATAWPGEDPIGKELGGLRMLLARRGCRRRRAGSSAACASEPESGRPAHDRLLSGERGLQRCPQDTG